MRMVMMLFLFLIESFTWFSLPSRSSMFSFVFSGITHSRTITSSIHSHNNNYDIIIIAIRFVIVAFFIVMATFIINQSLISIVKFLESFGTSRSFVFVWMNFLGQKSERFSDFFRRRNWFDSEGFI